jgi:hypothetical protein
MHDASEKDNYEKRQNALWGFAGIEYQNLVVIDIIWIFLKEVLIQKSLKLKLN